MIKHSEIILESKEKMFKQMVTAVACILLFYVALYSYLQYWMNFAVVFSGLIFLTPLTIYTYKVGHRHFSKSLFIISCQYYIFLSDLSLQMEAYINYYYIPSLMIPLLLFDAKEKRSVFIGCSLPFIFYTIELLVGSDLIAKNLTSKPHASGIFEIANFYGANIISLMFIVIFVSRIQALKNTLINKEKNESEALREAQRLSKTGSWNYHISQDKIFWSKQMFSIFPEDQEKGEPDFKRHASTIHPDDIEVWESNVKKCIETGCSYSMQFRTFKMVEGKKEVVWVEAIGKALKDQAGVIYALSGTCQDITERVLLQNEMEEQKAITQHNTKLASLGELAAGVGHEINNPLAVIQNYITIIKSKMDQAPRIESKTLYEPIDIMNTAIIRITDIVKGLRNFSRADSKSISTFSPLDAITETFNLINAIYERDGIKIQIFKPNEKLNYVVKGNRGGLQQVLMNLVSNARDAVSSQSSKEISISLEFDKKYTYIKVKDNGQGIPRDVVAKIFDPFFTTKGINKGTGIGLSLAHNIISEMKGSLTVQSNEGTGAEFQIKLPIEQQIETELIKSENKSQNNSIEDKLEGLTVLLVEDEEVLRKVVSRVLECLGLDVSIAENGEVAYNMITQNSDKYKIIISDINMPVMDGPTLLKNIRNNESIVQPKFIFSTGRVNIDLENSENEFNHMVDGVLPKPFTEASILDVLSKCLR